MCLVYCETSFYASFASFLTACTQGPADFFVHLTLSRNATAIQNRVRTLLSNCLYGSQKSKVCEKEHLPVSVCV